MKSAALITGDRNWDDQPYLNQKLISMLPKGTFIIQGGARGADLQAERFANVCGYPYARVPYFGYLGRSGGPARNKVMLDLLLGLREVGYQVEVIAFHTNITTSKGTKNMIDQADKANVAHTLFDGT